MKKLLSILFLFLFVASINAQVGQSRVLEVKEGQMEKVCKWCFKENQNV